MAGRLVHFELPAEDIDRAQGFYEQLFGWSFQGAGTPFPYRMTEAGGEPAGAIYKNEGRPPGVIVYFDVDDIDAHVARVRELGGRADDKMPIPGHRLDGQVLRPRRERGAGLPGGRLRPSPRKQVTVCYLLGGGPVSAGSPRAHQSLHEPA